jgi:5'-nucleotidase
MLILVDMDSVLADFEAAFEEKCRLTHPDFEFIVHEERTTFYLADSYPPELRTMIVDIYKQPTFFHDMPVIPGGVEAVREMADLGWQVFVCTHPFYINEHNFAGKYYWAETHIGKGWGERVIFASDKTMIRGNILIDDKPEISGVNQPEWEHIIFDRAYNRHVNGKRRLTWSNWREVLAP